jgi:hypothetical protein
MRYLVTTKDSYPFFTEWYDDNFFNDKTEMKVYDLAKHRYTEDGINWLPIATDRL